MRPRHPPPLWLVTDERSADPLGAAARLPRGSGILFRHHRTPVAARRALFLALRAVARRHGHLLVLAGDPRFVRAWGADAWHGRGRRHGVRSYSAPVHDKREIVAAERAGARLLFLSPLFPTRSHPDGSTLGPVRFALLARSTRLPVIALGGVRAEHARRVRRLGAHGWAGIDAWASC